MAKIFDVQDWLKNHPNRNNFDLTHKVHGSYQFGKLYPVLCKPVVPTDSFRIDTAVSLRFTPMPFPTQSNMRVIFHYFYVRNKNIWKNWANWLQGLEEHTPPYIDKPASFYKDGSLADHLGIPTSFTSVSSYEDITIGAALLYYNSGIAYWKVLNGVDTPISPDGGVSYARFLYYATTGSNLIDDLIPTQISPSALVEGRSYDLIYCLGSYFGGSLINAFVPTKYDYIPRTISFLNPDFNVSTDEGHLISLLQDGTLVTLYYYDAPLSTASNRSVHSVTYSWNAADKKFDFVASSYGGDYDSIKDLRFEPCYAYLLLPATVGSAYTSSSYPLYSPFSTAIKSEKFLLPAHVNVSDSDVASPFATSYDSDGKVKLSALPFRAYESIYNAFYRNSQGVQPFQIGGVTQYNKYVTNDGDGADTTNYSLFERNWELDAYTSCLISPQQGNVPYVGITDISALGNMRVETPDGNSAEVRLSDNGDGVEISNLRGDTPEARAYALRAASSGFTIPEFREANALQRFLEMNIRKGYKYIDFIEGHFGKKPTYAEMDMPEFIGGFSQRISVNEISNTNGVDNDRLGAIAGQARAIGGSKHGINHYFDDFGFVVGIMCIVPDNAYDSILPKHFNLKNPLDCYFPEFSQLSYMPLTHEELAPLQTINDPRGSSYRDLTKVFGYQRPNHDLVWYPDTVHGLFRDASGIGNSIVCRRFGVRPDLSDAFLRIKPEETDTIFNYTFGDNDVALGEIVFSIKAKRPIPRLVVPTIS